MAKKTPGDHEWSRATGGSLRISQNQLASAGVLSSVRATHDIAELSRRYSLVLVPALPGSGRTSVARALVERQESEKTGRVRTGRLRPAAEYYSLRVTADRARLRNGLEQIPDGSLLVIDDAEWGTLLPLVFHAASAGIQQRVRLVCFVPEAIPAAFSAIIRSPFTVYRFAGLSAEEVLLRMPDAWPTLWIRGPLARSFLASTDEESHSYREAVVLDQCRRYNPGRPAPLRTRTHEARFEKLRRALRERNAIVDFDAVVSRQPELRRFYEPRSVEDGVLRSYAAVVASAVAEPANYSAFGRAYGVSHETARSYVASLERGLLLQLQPPYTPRSRKRLVRRPRLLFSDTGLLHVVLGIHRFNELLGNVRASASWTNFVVHVLQQSLGLTVEQLPFWSTHTGASVDALWWPDAAARAGQPSAAIATLAARPRLTRAMQVACDDLRLERLWLICPGNQSYALSHRVQVVSIRDLAAVDFRAPLRHT